MFIKGEISEEIPDGEMFLKGKILGEEMFRKEEIQENSGGEEKKQTRHL